jgi:hypothetical protein
MGESFSLGVRGVAISAGAGTITLRASAVRWWPGGKWTSLVRERAVELAVADGAEVDRTLVAALESPERRALQSRGATPTVFTAYTGRAKVTAAALRGQSLVAARVTRPGGVTVKTKPSGDTEVEDTEPADDGGRSCVYPDPGCSS